jgi:glutathione S-transferase
MKLYYHPASTTCRPVMLFIAENKMNVEMKLVDLFTGEHMSESYGAINPSQLVPTLEEGDFRLTECSAILKYLADKIDSPAYPKDLMKRARVNERMDWINTQMCRDFAYGYVYPQILAFHKRPSEEGQRVQLAWGKERSQKWMKVLDRNIIGSNEYLCGNEITIADYLGVAFVHLGEVIRCDFSEYPNVKRWIGNMKRLSSWNAVNEAINGFAASLKDAALESI